MASWCAISARLFGAALLIVLAITAVRVHAAAPASEALDARLAALAAETAELDERVARAAEAATEVTAQQLGVSLDELQSRAAVLQGAKSYVERSAGAVDDLKKIREQQRALEQQQADFKGFDVPPPYTIAFVDELDGAANATQLALEAAREDLALTEEQAARTASRLGEAQKELDARKQAAGTSPPPNEMWQLGLRQDRLREAQAAVDYFQSRKTAQEARVALLAAELDWQQRKRDMAKERSSFTKDELDQKLAALGERKAELDAVVDKARIEHERLESRAASARQSLEKARMAGAAEEELRALAGTLDTQDIVAQNARQRYEILRDLRESYERARPLWELRYKVLDPARRTPPAALNEEIAGPLQAITKRYEGATRQFLAVQASGANLAQQLAQPGLDPAQSARLQAQADSYASVEDALRQWIGRLLELRQLATRIKAEVDSRMAAASVDERWRTAMSRVAAVWNYELTQIQGSPLTIRKLVVALSVFFIGLMLSRLFVRWLRNRAFKRMRLDESVAASISKMVYYFLLFLVGYYALTVVSIPLTVFTFLGGALAIGVGFGAQNLINNFISGVILMVERPIKIHDIVEVEGRTGTVVTIGARCSRLRTFSGVDYLIPNSAFLEKNVVNWTLSDARVRFSVSVGVAYGSPTREVERLIMQAVTEHDKVLKDPAPVVLFAEFADNSLNFEAYFWVLIGGDTDSRIVRSDIRHRIDQLFKDAGIVIAFPQRDIHLDATRPLEVRVVSPDR